MKKHNFSAGPCILPEDVIQQASKSVLNFNNNDLSLIEISHRSQPFVDVMNKARSLVRKLLDIPKGYSILFLQGGASLEFAMVPMNLMKKEEGQAALQQGTRRRTALGGSSKARPAYSRNGPRSSGFPFLQAASSPLSGSSDSSGS